MDQSAYADALKAAVNQALDQHIRPLFNVEPKFTVVIRFPRKDDAYVVVSNDDDAGIRTVLESIVKQQQ